MLSVAYNQLNTTNLALNKVAEVLAYDVRNILLYSHQVCWSYVLQAICISVDVLVLSNRAALQLIEQVFPLLLTFGGLTSAPSSTELQFATALPGLSRAAKASADLALLLSNLLQQLGALCSEQTRKSTVVSGQKLLYMLPMCT